MIASNPRQFLDLPGEIRNMIYLEILAPTRYVTLARAERSGVKFKAYPSRSKMIFRQDLPSSSDALSFAILRTCKQIYNETKYIFYQENCLDLRLDTSAYKTQFLGILDKNCSCRVHNACLGSSLDLHQLR